MLPLPMVISGTTREERLFVRLALVYAIDHLEEAAEAFEAEGPGAGNNKEQVPKVQLGDWTFNLLTYEQAQDLLGRLPTA